MRASVVAAISLLVAQSATAQTLQMQLQAGGGPPITIVDNGPGDTSPTVGWVSYIGPVGSYVISVVTGLSKPYIGTPANAIMDLNVLAVQGSATGPITISLTDVNFDGPINGVVLLNSAVGGTTDSPATTSVQAFVDAANAPFATSGLTVCSPGIQQATGPSFASTLTATCAVNGPYSMTIVSTATLGPGRSVGFDHEVSTTSQACGAIGDFVWHDENRNGIQDPGEPGINGVRLFLKENGNILATTTTGLHPMGSTSGYYQFSNVCSGDYEVEIDPTTVPPGFTPTLKDIGSDTTDNDSNGNAVPVSLPNDGDSNQTIDFGFHTPCTGMIGDFVWHDLNQNGQQDPLEPGIPNITLRIVETGQTTVTDATGFYQFTGLCAGTYTVEVVTPPVGMVATTSGVGDPTTDSNGSPTFTTLTADDSVDLTLDFGYYTPCTGAIGNFVWNDLDRDGVQDPGEPGIQGVRITLKNGLGVQVAEVFTDANGFYEFLGYCGDEYTVTVDPASVPPGLTPSPTGQTSPDLDSNPNPTVFTLPNNTIDHTIDFGFMPPCDGRIGNFVWVDLNANGLQDPGEPGIPNVGLELRLQSDNSLIAVTTTDANGFYQFTGLCRNAYTVVVVPPAGYVATTVEGGTDTTIDSNPNPALVTLPTDFGSNQTIDFGFVQPAALGDFVWHDLNADGDQDPGEPGIAGVTVTLLDCDGNILATTATDGNGLYLFENLMPGCYRVRFTTPAGYGASPANAGGDDAKDSDSVGGTTGNYTLASGETNLTVDAGFHKLAELGDFVWYDIDADGIQDAGEPGIGGVTVTLHRCGTVAVVATTTTNGAGFYLFSGLTPGCYYVRFVKPAGYAGSSPANVGADATDSDADTTTGITGNYVLASGESNRTVDAGYYKLAELGDFVWHDLDADGIQDAGEPGIGGVTVTLHRCGSAAVIATTATNAAGFYLFSNLEPGCYYVTFVKPAGYVSSPANVGNDAADSDANTTTGVTGNYTLASGESNRTVDAGFYKLAQLGDYVWKDLNSNGIQETGEPGIAGVLVTLLRCDDTQVATQNTDANGKYLFTNLVPGCYKVRFATPAGLSATTPNVGNDALDSDAVSGITGNYTLVSGESNLTVDAGFIAPPPPCIPTTFNFTGKSAISGTKGNIRTFTMNGISVNASAFSRTDSNGDWHSAYLGAYSSGLGVTDTSEGDGSNDRHVVDNAGGRDNYILFEFSQPVVVTKAFLDYVGDDSDITVWVGTKTNPFTNHLTLSDALLASLTSEMSLGSNGSARWASFNGAALAGNVVVIAAKHNESNGNDSFKLSKLGLDCYSAPPPPCVETTIAFSGNSSASGTAGNIRTFTGTGVSVKASAFSRKDSNGEWNTAYLGLYPPGLGVTDGSEGNGGNDTHKIDNIGGRDNYVLLEFSQPVIIDQAFLDYVGDDSDITVWIGTKNDPFNNHLTLSDALLASLTKETNTTTSANSRWADFNGLQLSGNVVVIAAQHDDTNPEDSFKLSKIKLDCVSAPPPPPPPVCVTKTFSFTGNTSGSGSAGNIRTFTADGVSVKVSAFSRRDDNGSWATAYLGLFGPGLGVTDGSEGDGSNDRHKVDNIGGRGNYVMFEFSQKVTITQAFLDAVGADSDITVWIGTKNDPFNNHLTLSDALLATMDNEDNLTTSGDARWASFNGDRLAGNVIVISALHDDDSPEDAFKISKLKVTCP